MPGSNPLPIDLRSYRPAAVFVMDLVKHSVQNNPTSKAVQSVLTETVEAALSALHIGDVHFSHTGDGYVCTFIGDSSVRILDFINELYPRLTSRLDEYGQKIRAGVAFGIVHLRRNPLTHSDTHFDLPGIEASRLEQVAEPGQILCTATVYAIFSRHYPTMFGSDMCQFQTKDRTIGGYALQTSPPWVNHLRQNLSDFLFRRSPEYAIPREGAILIVDDERMMRHALKEILADCYPERQIIDVGSGEDALVVFGQQSVAVIITDLVMPGLSGLEMMAIIKESVSDQIVIGISGYGSIEQVLAFIRNGGFYFLPKPFDHDQLVRIVQLGLAQPRGDKFRSELAEICDDAVSVWSILYDVSTHIDGILSSAGRTDDIAQDLLRHKAKHLVNDALCRLTPGVDALVELCNLRTQLSCVERLARIVGRLGVQSIGEFIGSLINDLRRMHPRLEIVFIDNVSDVKAEVNYGGVVILAIAELIDNAIAAINGRGKVEVDIATLNTAGMLQITVRDSGPGVASTIRDRMFDENVSTKGAGRGLGLHLIQEATRLLRGSISYSQDEGSTFTIQLPLKT